MEIENNVSNDFWSTFVDSLTSFIAANPVYNLQKYLKDIQLIFTASYRMTNELQHVISNNVAFWHE